MWVRIFVVLAALVVQQIAQATVFSCPKKTSASLKTINASNIWLYHYNPKQQALLKPYNGDSNEEPKYWLNNENGNWSENWYRCLYLDGDIVVDIKMEGNFKKCSRIRKSTEDVYIQCE